ncbi:hypothetical protein EST38_g5617 [Candolleomyces aberdarensis]|uniref:Uncharacterized protein n=2 Tax=Candolleomyces TaxID=2791032 RepID=A0A4Q2DM27_9AGAR|nr:hypothetical protein EST38_g5617 [Candolleomyces aberdarensis]
MHVHGHHMPMSSPNVQLPRNLARPPFAEVSRDSIMAAAPELASVPAEYIRRGLRPKANQHLKPSQVPDADLHTPFTIALVYFRASTRGPTTADLPNTCSSRIGFKIPILQRAPDDLPASSPGGSTITLPVLPLTLPSPAAFSILHQFMYHHRLDSVLQALFPLPSAFLHNLSHQTVQSTLASGTMLHQLSTYVCSSASSNLATLTTHAAHVKELWQDMVALGLHDPELWDTVDLAWEIVLGALNLAAAQR